VVFSVGIFRIVGLFVLLSEDDKIDEQIQLLEKGQYEEIDIFYISERDGWIEIIDENYGVIYSKGNVEEVRSSYTKIELDAIISPENIPYTIKKYDFESNTGENLVLISKIPKDNNYESGTSKYVKNSMSELLILFMGLYALNVMFRIRWLNKKVKEPLTKINKAMKEFTESNEEIYLDYEGEEEFVQICNSFNHLVRRLKTVEREKAVIEESRQKILADLSHDLKTPITTIQGYAKAISEGLVTETDDINKYLNIIYKKSNKVADLINMQFEYVKLRHPDFKLSLASNDLCEFIREIIAENYEYIEDKGFLLEVSFPEKQLMFEFDKNQLRRAISNLISNSINYNDPGTSIKVVVEETEAQYIIFVADNGIGIPEHIKNEIFVPFVMGDESRNTTNGTGLGLSITKEIIEKHGGEINLVSSKESEYVTQFKIVFQKPKK
jgi:signal transduction histidine kinase